MASGTMDGLGLTSPGTEQDRLNKLLSLFDEKINLGDGPLDVRMPNQSPRKRVQFLDAKEDDDDRPLLTQRVKTFYMDKVMDVSVKPGDNTIRPRSGSRNLIGGAPITIETAIAIKNILFGPLTTHANFCHEWKKSVINFYDISGPFPYGLQTLKCGSRALVLGLQGYVLKHLIFDRQFTSVSLVRTALSPNEFERKRALLGAMCQLLWQSGERRRCCVCLQQVLRCYPQDWSCRDDGVTEKIVLFEFKKYQELEMFMKRHITEFQREGNNGCIMFLYSLILSRGLHRIYDDMQAEQGTLKLLTDNEECEQALLNMMLTGKATPFLHNGKTYYNDEGVMFSKPRIGIKERSYIGFLLWDKNELPEERTEVGSMLKTPRCPIWLTQINGQTGLLFSNNIDLVSDWRVENLFACYYYTGLANHKPCTLEVETRHGRQVKGRTLLTRKQEEEKIPQLEQCVMTKWYGAAVKWKTCDPFY